jgi:hypothetical protein
VFDPLPLRIKFVDLSDNRLNRIPPSLGNAWLTFLAYGPHNHAPVATLYERALLGSVLSGNAFSSLQMHQDGLRVVLMTRSSTMARSAALPWRIAGAEYELQPRGYQVPSLNGVWGTKTKRVSLNDHRTVEGAAVACL